MAYVHIGGVCTSRPLARNALAIVRLSAQARAWPAASLAKCRLVRMPSAYAACRYARGEWAWSILDYERAHVSPFYPTSTFLSHSMGLTTATLFARICTPACSFDGSEDDKVQGGCCLRRARRHEQCSTINEVVRPIEQAANGDIKLLVFPDPFVPGYPVGRCLVETCTGTCPSCNHDSCRLIASVVLSRMLRTTQAGRRTGQVR
jgi:hypothetical protein